MLKNYTSLRLRGLLNIGSFWNMQDRANRIQSDLDDLVKALNERCKSYGLRAKPTSLVELPFGNLSILNTAELIAAFFSFLLVNY